MLLEVIYWMQLLNADLNCVRKGMIQVGSLKGAGWKNFSMAIEKKAAPLYQEAIPIKFRKMYMAETPFVFRMIINLCKVFMKKKLMQKLHMCKLEVIEKKAAPLYQEA